MANATIDSIKVGGRTYDIADSYARSLIGGSIHIVGETSTALTDLATTNPIDIIDTPGTPPTTHSYTAVQNDAVYYSHKEFVFDGTNWHEFGDITGLGSLAFKNSASGNGDLTGATASAPVVTLATTTIDTMTNAGTMFSATVDGTTLQLNPGTAPTKGSATVASGSVTSVTAPTISGGTVTVTVS